MLSAFAQCLAQSSCSVNGESVIDINSSASFSLHKAENILI